jgi:hypothetical protein
MTHVLAFAFGLFVGAIVCWLATRARGERAHAPETREFAELIRDARKRCGGSTGKE